MRPGIFFFAFALFAQNPIVTVATPPRVTAVPGESVRSSLSIRVGDGFHANSNTPADPFLIPLRLTWSGGPLETVDVVFPKPQIQNLGFSKKPVSVFTGEFSVVTNFKVAADAKAGAAVVIGKLHYQACDDRSCFPPATVEVRLPVEIVEKESGRR